MKFPVIFVLLLTIDAVNGIPKCDPATEQRSNSAIVVESWCGGRLWAFMRDGCLCREGFARRRDTKRCIPEAECPVNASACGENEYYSPCGVTCMPTCRNPYPRCTRECVPSMPACQCRPGFVRHPHRCIPVEECPVHTVSTMFEVDGRNNDGL